MSSNTRNSRPVAFSCLASKQEIGLCSTDATRALAAAYRVLPRAGGEANPLLTALVHLPRARGAGWNRVDGRMLPRLWSARWRDPAPQSFLTPLSPPPTPPLPFHPCCEGSFFVSSCSPSCVCVYLHHHAPRTTFSQILAAIRHCYSCNCEAPRHSFPLLALSVELFFFYLNFFFRVKHIFKKETMRSSSLPHFITL